MTRVWVCNPYVRGKRRFQLVWKRNDGSEVRRLLPAGTTQRAADKAAAAMENELEEQVVEHAPCCWTSFVVRFQDEYLNSRSQATKSVYETALSSYARLMRPGSPDHITASSLSKFCALLAKDGLSPQTTITYMKHLRAAVRWAHRVGIVKKIPLFEMPRAIQTTNKGRPLTRKEVLRMVAAIKFVRGMDDEPDKWKRLVWGLYLSGLRLGEALKLSWDSPPVRLDFGGKYPSIVWSAAGHKARRNQVTPITPDFAEFLKRFPNQKGSVFGINYRTHWAGRLISRAGDRARVHTGAGTATAHDLRRTFATEWAQKVKPVTLKSMMRHSDIKTTLAYYVDLQTEDVGAEIWKSFQ